MRGATAGMRPTPGARLAAGWLCLGLLLALLAACSDAVTANGTSLPIVEPIEAATPTPEEPTATPTPRRPTATATRIPTATRPPENDVYAPPAPAATPTETTLPIAPGFVEETVYVYYTIAGASAAELRAQMETRGPGGAGSAHYDATAEWRFNWAYRSMPGPNGCAVDSVGVRAKITLTLPKWTPAADAPPALRERWNLFSAALLVHEDGHRQIAIAHGQELVRVLQELPPAPTCEALKPTVDAAAKAVLDRLARADAEYDRRTRHGLEQGTKFP